MPSAARHAVKRPPTRYLRLRRVVYHMLGGEGHNDVLVKAVDFALMTLITINCVFSILESVENLALVHGHIFHAFDRFSVAIFSVEYLLRVWTAVEMENPRFHPSVMGRIRYVLTPMALVDLVAIVPFYLGMFFEVDLRAMRVLRLLRVFKLTRYSQAMSVLLDVLRREARALSALLFIFLVILVFVSSLMYMFEHPHQPHIFSDIPAAMWWAVVTMTTLGYGDMVPMTAPGRFLGACTAVVGLGMIALPAGILASGFNEAIRQRREEYMETMERAQQTGRRLTSRERRDLEETRIELGLSQAEAAALLKKAAEGRATRCPRCGAALEGEAVNPRP